MELTREDALLKYYDKLREYNDIKSSLYTYNGILSSSYNSEQLNIIKDSINNGCDYNQLLLIANPNFSTNQMIDIADDLLFYCLPLDVVKEYAKPEYTDGTLRTISSALESGVPFEEIEPLLNPVNYNELLNLIHKYKSSK